MEEKIKAIIKKINKMFRYSMEMRNFFKSNPYARVELKKDGSWDIKSIYFEDGMRGCVLFVLPTEIKVYDRHKDDEDNPKQDPYTIIVKYKNYDELLALD